jgi:coenzyme F420 hydrogenase subunit beta
MKTKRTVADIVHDKLCLGCGTCDGICPQRAIGMVYSTKNRTYVPIIDSALCTLCGLCFMVCPGLHASAKAPVPRHGSSDDRGPLSNPFGVYRKCFIGHASDQEIRYRASSGGIATVLSAYVLEAGRIDAVVTTRMKKDFFIDTEPALCRSRKEVMNSMGSKYCPAATNSILKAIDTGLLNSVMFTGLPCHMTGLYNARALHPLKTLKKVVTIGLLCGGMRGQEGTDWILKKRNIAMSSLSDITYRGDGWPGSMKLISRDRATPAVIPYAEYGDEYFESWQPWRCFLCVDRTSQTADIALGDAWLPELKKDTMGTSLILARTDKGLHLIEEALSNGIIEAQEIDSDTVARSQKGLVFDIEHSVESSLYLARLMGRRTPENGVVARNPGWQVLSRSAAYLLRAALLRKMTTSAPLFRVGAGVGRLKRGIKRISSYTSSIFSISR